MNKQNTALVKLAIGFLSVGAVAGIAGRLSWGTSEGSRGNQPRFQRPDLRSHAPTDRYQEDDWYGEEFEQWGQSDIRIVPPAQAWTRRNQPRRTRSRGS